MSNMKELVKALNETKSQLDIKLIGLGHQKENDWSQETAVESSTYSSRTDNYILEINGGAFVFDVCKIKAETKYEAMEDEWVSDVTVDKNEVEYSLKPYYVMEGFENMKEELSESYKDDLKTGQNEVPEIIKELEVQLKKMSHGAKYIQPEDDDLADYEEELRHEHPDLFMPRKIDPISFKTDVLFDLPLNMDNLMDKVDFYDLESIEPIHNQKFPKSKMLDNLKEKGIKLNDFRKLNEIANSSGNPSAFLNKLNKFSNTEMTEMFHMMDKGNKVVEIFSKDLEKHELSQEVKKRRDRSNKVR